MLGAMIGDIAGSRFEFNNYRDKDFDLFAKECFATDDSIMTLAVAKAIMETERRIGPSISGYDSNLEYFQLLAHMTARYMQEIGRRYPNCGYGGMFARWMFSGNPEPYNSFGNGAAMRISPAGFAARSELEAMCLSKTITAVTHNHEEGIKGAEAVAVAVYMARHGFLKSEIRDRISRDYYPLDFTVDQIRPTYQFNETCQETVPQAIAAFLESTSFEDAIRTAVSLGGDSDTIAAIAGAIAEAYYGVPGRIRDKALSYLDDELRAIYEEWEDFIGRDASRFNVLTKYIGRLTPAVSSGGLVHEPQYETLFYAFYNEFMDFIETHYPQYCEDGIFYASVLRDRIIDEAEVAEGNVDGLDALAVLAVIHRELISGCRWNYNEMDSFKDEKFVKWLKRLKDIDWQVSPRKLSEVYLAVGGGYGGYHVYHLLLTARKTYRFTGKIVREAQSRKWFSSQETERLLAAWNDIHTEYWKFQYPQEGPEVDMIPDGTQWSLFVRYEGFHGVMYGGDNTFPENWGAFLDFFGIEGDGDLLTPAALDAPMLEAR